ncbi:regulatory factor X [Exophiala viscosa]|uniref:Regulatory factor X n=1 Tax=Exophiala viscosa TaxID=2486360 RepID=A0AAN6IHQ7_9EURO|nr:regulatory factor X [Exophiala viscosa]
MPQSPTHSMEEEAPEPQGPTHTNNATSNKEKRRPKSRGSTTSLQSVGVGSAFQPAPHEDDPTMPIEHNGFFVHPQAAAIYGHNPEEMLMHYQHNMAAHLRQQSIEHPPNISQHEMRPISQQGFQEMQPFPLQYPHHIPFGVPPQHMQHMRHQSEQFEGSPAPEDSQTENGGAKRRKANASSVANDQELRRLLAQYQGKSLKEVAAEVQKNEGSGGKSEKAKQVFAMLWLQENCQRSSQSVRRDRVFTRYTERCGNERVPTLNPASFGKLVRIIFPNVQTRRLGVRGESKYHYVDLSLIMDDDDRQYGAGPERPATANGHRHERHGSVVEANKAFKTHITPTIERPMSRATMETADFPAPSAAFLSKDTGPTDDDVPESDQAHVQKLDCKYINTPTIRLPIKTMPSNVVAALPSIRPNLPASMSAYLGMPTMNSLSQVPTSQDPIEFPDIHPYLEGTTYDVSIAKALFHLYRSYCIDVIDAFRKCKEKPFFNHHSAFNGKMTVPVSKLFSMECLAPWIQECDMRMYKQIVRFIAPLVLQNVPEVVWTVFERIGSRLVGHLITAFEEKCPVHVVVAKTVPAARFVNVLKKLKGANAATMQLSHMLDDPQQRTQMWLDLMAMVDPDRLLEDSMPPPESLEKLQGVLRHDLRPLVSPLDGELTRAAEDDPTSAYANFVNDISDSAYGVLLPDTSGELSPLLERWISWLERLPQLFQGHHPQCMIDWHSRLWSSVMMQMGQNGAHSYQSWWFVESFATQMLSWMTQMEGLLLDEETQKLADEREQEKCREINPLSSSLDRRTKRKRSEDDIPDLSRLPKKFEQVPGDVPGLPRIPTGEEATQDIDDDATDADLDELRRGGPLDLPSFHTGLSSPIKRQQANTLDDSGIDLGLDVDIEAEKEARKFNKRDWLLSSDPVDPPIGLGVMV